MRLLYHVVMVYMILAFGWWALLLHMNTKETYSVRKDHLLQTMINNGAIAGVEEFEQTPTFLELSKKYESQKKMIIGEAVVFMITLLVGLWLINKGYDREIKANQQRRNFLLSITHELKSPLSSVRLLIETMMKRELPRPKTVELLSNAHEENERLYGLVENLLLSAKLEGHYNPFFEEFNLLNLIEELIAKQRVKHPEVSFTLKAAANFPVVRMDRQGIMSVINNLLENAIKYSKHKPRIAVILAYDATSLTIEVRDNGQGVPISERKRIFEKFYRIGSEETRKSKGTGLGLFIVDQIVRAHKGSITVSENEPKGSIFKINMPT